MVVTDLAVTHEEAKVGYPEVTLGADGAGVRVRQVLQRRLAAEGRSLA